MRKGEHIKGKKWKRLLPLSLPYQMECDCLHVMNLEAQRMWASNIDLLKGQGWIHVQHSLWHTLDKPELSNGSSHSWVTFSFWVAFLWRNFHSSPGAKQRNLHMWLKEPEALGKEVCGRSVDPICKCSGSWRKLNYDSSKFVSNFNLQILDPLPHSCSVSA